MTSKDHLKIAFVLGVEKSIRNSGLSEKEAFLVKEALFRRLGGFAKRLFKGIPKEFPAGAAKEEVAQAAEKMRAFKGLRSAGYNPLASTQEAAKFYQKAGPKAEEWLGKIRQSGKGLLTSGTVSYLLPTAVGAGVGYAAGGRQGALTGAGFGLGARLGASGMLRGLEEARGFTKMMGKEIPNLSRQMLNTAAGKKALVASGILAPGLATAGYMFGRRREPKKTWYSGLGLTPQQTQQLGQMAMPMLSEQLGLDPALVRSLASSYGLIPTQGGAASTPQTLSARQIPSEQYGRLPEEYINQYSEAPQGTENQNALTPEEMQMLGLM